MPPCLVSMVGPASAALHDLRSISARSGEEVALGSPDSNGQMRRPGLCRNHFTVRRTQSAWPVMSVVGKLRNMAYEKKDNPSVGSQLYSVFPKYHLTVRKQRSGAPAFLESHTSGSSC